MLNSWKFVVTVTTKLCHERGSSKLEASRAKNYESSGVANKMVFWIKSASNVPVWCSFKQSKKKEFLVKNAKKMKFWASDELCTSKESREHGQFIFRLKKKRFFKENYIFIKILIFHRRVPLWIGNLQYFPKKFGNLKNDFAGTSLV